MEATSKWNAALRIQGRDSRIAEQSKELIALQAENARLREMLQGMVWDAEATYDAVKKSTHGAEISIGQFRRLNAARAALAGSR